MINILKNNNQKVNYTNADYSSIKKSKVATLLSELTAKCGEPKEKNLHTTGKFGIKKKQTRKLFNAPPAFKEKFFEYSSHLIKNRRSLTPLPCSGGQTNLSVTKPNIKNFMVAKVRPKIFSEVAWEKILCIKNLTIPKKFKGVGCARPLLASAIPSGNPKLIYENLKCNPGFKNILEGKFTYRQSNTTSLIYKRHKDDPPVLHGSGRPLLREKTYLEFPFQKIQDISKVSQKQGKSNDSKLFVKNSVEWCDTFRSTPNLATLASKFTNLLMMDGKKGKAAAIFSKTLTLFKRHVENISCNHNHGEPKEDRVSVINKKSTFDFLNQAVKNAKPTLEVRNKKIAGITRQIPAVVPRKRQETLAIRWIIKAAKKKKDNYKTFPECLAQELVDAFQKNGQPHQNRNALHKTAEANRFFIRHRWW